MKQRNTHGMATEPSRLTRSSFLKLLAWASIMNVKSIAGEAGQRMPVMFVGHGSPMNAIQENDNTKGWKEMAKGLNPRAVLCISAHWETQGSKVTMVPNPKTIYDFYGFPPELYAVKYPAPGAPDLGSEITRNVKLVAEDHEWGLDHGTWCVVRHMFPAADVPVIQLSLDQNMSPQAHYDLARQLAFLRRQGVLIIGSGNVVHNLGELSWESREPYEWALEFDGKVEKHVREHDHATLIKCEEMNRAASLSIPTREHYLPLLYILALQERDEQVNFFNDRLEMGSISMRSLVIS